MNRYSLQVFALLPFVLNLAAPPRLSDDNGQRPQAGHKISFESSGKPLPQLFSELNTEFGTKLAVSDKTANELLVVRFHNVELAEALKQIASTLDATWVQANGRQVLTREPGQVRDEEKVERRRLVEGFSRALKSNHRLCEEQPAFTEERASNLAEKLERATQEFNRDGSTERLFREFQGASPGERAIAKLIDLVSPETLAELPPHLAVVFSTRPTQSEQRLSEEALGVGQSFIREQTTWSEVASNQKFSPLLYRGSRINGSPLLSSTGKPSGNPDRVLLTACSTGHGKSVSFQMMVVGRNGSTICQSYKTLSPSLGSEEVDNSDGSGEQKIEAPRFLDELLPRFGSGHFIPTKLETEFRRQLLQPDLFEPLAYVAGPSLLSVAEMNDQNLVASVGDDFLLAGWTDSTPPTPTRFLERAKRAGYEVASENGWMSVRPISPIEVREQRVNRLVLREFLRYRETASSTSLDQLATFYARMPLPTDNYLPCNLVARLEGHRLVLNYVDVLRFYGSLSNEQREMAKSSDGLPFSELTGLQAQFLESVTYGAYSRMSIETNGKPVGDVFSLATESLPNGIMPTGRMHLAVEEAPQIFDVRAPKQGLAGEEACSTYALAMLLLAKTHPELTGDMDSHRGELESPRYVGGTRRTYRFDFQYSSQVHQLAMEVEDVKSSAPVAFDQLDDRYKQSVFEQLKYARQERQGKTSSASSGGTP